MANIDNYLPCEDYESAPDSEKFTGFKSWFDTDTGNWYFAAVTNKGRVTLRSEAYTTEAARDNGIESVIKNRDLEERYKVVQDEADGQWYVSLRAGNHQEIARSCPFNTENEANNGVKMCFSDYTDPWIIDNYMPCDYYSDQAKSEKYPGFNAWQGVDSEQYFFAAITNKGNVTLRSEAYTTEASRDNGIESVIKNRDLEERYKVVQDEADGQWYISLRAGNHQEIARSCAFESEAAASAGIAMCYSTYTERAASTGIVDDYLACEQYAAAPASEKYPGFNAWYNEEDNSHYFAAVTNKGRVTLRSEAYTTEAARNNGIESVIKNRDLEERYKVVQDEADGQWYVSLRAGNHQEIARSCAYESEAAVLAGIKHSYSNFIEKDSISVIIEDYLPCEVYSARTASKHEGFTEFMDDTTGLHYFAMVDKSGKVILKSEGYKTAESRDNGIESVIRNRDIEERWVQEKDDEGHYMSLHAGNHQEIARTCHFSSEGTLMGWWLPFTGLLAFGKNDAVLAPDPVIEKAIPAPVIVKTEAPAPPPPIVVKPEIPPPPPISTYMAADDVAAAATSGGSNWWKWLLPLLLLGLLFLLWKGCDGCGKKEAPPQLSTTPAPAPVDTVKKAPVPAPAPAPVCNCSAATDPVFKAPGGSPKSLSRLGTNPEFGDSHAQDEAGFYDKLANRYKTNSVDKAFLDRMYKAMGYSGFADAKADQYTSTVLPIGTSGNLGYSKMHKTGYYTLPDAERDRQAFRIKAANGCDLHFMKTCGNHFFVCPK